MEKKNYSITYDFHLINQEGKPTLINHKLTPLFLTGEGKMCVKRIKLYFDQITHIQGLKDYAIIHASAERIVIKGSIKMVQEMLPVQLFIRVHKSFLVAHKAIKRIQHNKITIGTYQIPIGRNYRETLEQKINLNR
ncbi:LytR/AlgR family response regulator transcription factor [Pedobacter psychrodurus]|uniref:LytR/AlgR family response regulator transcription factor n=1 Tax=Pedobacter psychrodurus TaxID=2530456 RepID=UPI001980987C|nr:LytTR family DNA-binding domain-containing protein [Pedobacter psychrodurus]